MDVIMLSLVDEHYPKVSQRMLNYPTIYSISRCPPTLRAFRECLKFVIFLRTQISSPKLEYSAVSELPKSDGGLSHHPTGEASEAM